MHVIPLELFAYVHFSIHVCNAARDARHTFTVWVGQGRERGVGFGITVQDAAEEAIAQHEALRRAHHDLATPQTMTAAA